MEILVTGGNGFVGHHLVSALLDRGDRVRVLALPEEDVRWLEDRAVTIHRGDIGNPEAVLAAMRSADGVIHLAAMMHVWRPLEDYFEVNVVGTTNVCQMALVAGIRRLVHMSSSSVYGMESGRIVDETSPMAPFADPYPVSKAEADRVVQQMIAEAGLPGVVIRPDQIFGPGDHLHFGSIATRLRRGTAIVVGRGHNALPLVYVDDVVQGLLLALDDDRAIGGVFNITNDAPLTQQEFMEAIARHTGGRPPRVHVPYRGLYAAACAAERIAGTTAASHRPLLTRLGVAFLGTDQRYSIAKARRELGYSPRVGLHEGVRRTAAWHRSEDGDQAAVSSVNHRLPLGNPRRMRRWAR